MNIFNKMHDNLLSFIDEKQDDFIDQYITNHLTLDNSINRCESRTINIIGKQCSGKTTLLNKLLASLEKIAKYKTKLYLKHIKVIDSYNERETFEELITFYKNTIGKSKIKVLVIDDFTSFSKLFKSKVTTLLKQRSGIQISILVGENGLNVNNEHINGDYKKYINCLNTSHMLTDTIREFIHSHIDNRHTRETEIVSYLINNFTETDNIRTLLNNITILSHMDFNDPNGMYFYNNVVENVYIYNCLYDVCIDAKKLIQFLKNKYRNNENVKDIILLIETSVFCMLQSATNRDNKQLEIELHKILNVCYDVKNQLLHLKRNNQTISNKLLFNYFILKLDNLYI